MLFPHFNHGLIQIPFIVILSNLLLFFSIPHTALCQAPASPSEFDAKQMMARLRSALEREDTILANQIGHELQALGKAALPAIQDGLPTCNPAEAKHFTRILGGIDGSESTQLLIQLACLFPDSSIVTPAINAVGNRPIDFNLTANQFERLLTEVRKGPAFTAGAAAQILTRSPRNEKIDIVRPILERFMAEIGQPTTSEKFHGSYLSPQAYRLNLFLRTFADMRDQAIPEIKDALQRATAHETKKWLALALGMCGDKSVAQDIRSLIENDPDTSFRVVAVRAYARSDGENAVPLLQTLLTDNSQSEYDRMPDGSPVYPIRIAARSELARLTNAPAR